jgi:hypothetical protein
MPERRGGALAAAPPPALASPASSLALVRPPPRALLARRTSGRGRARRSDPPDRGGRRGAASRSDGTPLPRHDRAARRTAGTVVNELGDGATTSPGRGDAAAGRRGAEGAGRRGPDLRLVVGASSAASRRLRHLRHHRLPGLPRRVECSTTVASAGPRRSPTPPARCCSTTDGAPILARYFSTSGGGPTPTRRSSPATGPRPYLVAIDDPFDAVSPYHRWQVRFTREEFDEILSRGRRSRPRPGRRGGAARRGRRPQARLPGHRPDGTVVEVGALELRDFLSPVAPAASPTASRPAGPTGCAAAHHRPVDPVRVEVTDDEVVLDGRGWGHGVGLGQYGARGRAERGRPRGDPGRLLRGARGPTGRWTRSERARRGRLRHPDGGRCLPRVARRRPAAARHLPSTHPEPLVSTIPPPPPPGARRPVPAGGPPPTGGAAGPDPGGPVPPGAHRTRQRRSLRDVPSPYGLWIAVFSVLIFVAPNLVVLGISGIDGLETVVLESTTMIVVNLIAGLVLQVVVFGLALLPLLAAGRPYSRLWGPTRTTGAMVGLGLAVGFGVAIVAYIVNIIVVVLVGVEDPVQQQLLQDALAGGLPLPGRAAGGGGRTVRGGGDLPRRALPRARGPDQPAGRTGAVLRHLRRDPHRGRGLAALRTAGAVHRRLPARLGLPPDRQPDGGRPRACGVQRHLAGSWRCWPIGSTWRSSSRT